MSWSCFACHLAHVVVQGSSGRRPSAPVEPASNRPSAPVGISRLSAPIQAAVSMQATLSEAQGMDTSNHPVARTQPKTAATDLIPTAAVTAAEQGLKVRAHSEQMLAAAGIQHTPAGAVPDSINNSIYYNMGTADRPLSSFAQTGGFASSARPAGGGSRATVGATQAAYRTQQVAEPEASVASGSAYAAGKQVADGSPASAASLVGSGVSSGQHKQGYLPQPSHAVGQSEQHQERYLADPQDTLMRQTPGYSAEPPHEVGLSGQSTQGHSAAAPHETSLLPSPGSTPNPAGISPQNSMDPFESRASTQHHPMFDSGLSPNTAQWRTEYGSDSLERPAVIPAGTAGHAVAANYHRPTAAPGAGLVALAPGVDRGQLQPTSAGMHPPGLDVANNRLGAAAAAMMSAPNKSLEEDVGAASPSTFSSTFLGQSVDLSKVSLLGQSMHILLGKHARYTYRKAKLLSPDGLMCAHST